MTLYSTAIRRAELCRLDVDSQRIDDSHSPGQGSP
jgi:hypothetical protein